jgi:hypothetical protein
MPAQRQFTLAEYLGRTDAAIQATAQGILCLRYPPAVPRRPVQPCA